MLKDKQTKWLDTMKISSKYWKKKKKQCM